MAGSVSTASWPPRFAIPTWTCGPRQGRSGHPDRQPGQNAFSAPNWGVLASSNRRLTTQWSGFATALRDAIQPVDTVLQLSGGGVQSTLVVEGDTSRIQMQANLGRASIAGLQGLAVYMTDRDWRFRATYNVTWGRDAEGHPLSHIPPAFGMCTASKSWTHHVGHPPAVERMETRRRLRAGCHGQPGGGHGGRNTIGGRWALTSTPG